MKPITFLLPITEPQFKLLHDALNEHVPAPQVNEGEEAPPVSETTGHIDNSDISFDWAYKEPSLQITVTAAHSLKARLASSAMIEESVTKYISTYLAENRAQ